MDQHLCVVQTVDRNPFKTIGSTSRCPRTRQTRRGRSKCLVSFLVSLVVGRKGSSSHAPLLTDSFCWVSGESESDYHPAHRSTFPPDLPSPHLAGLINTRVMRVEPLSLPLSISPSLLVVYSCCSDLPAWVEWSGASVLVTACHCLSHHLSSFLSSLGFHESWITFCWSLTNVSALIFFINEIQIGQFCP